MIDQKIAEEARARIRVKSERVWYSMAEGRVKTMCVVNGCMKKDYVMELRNHIREE